MAVLLYREANGTYSLLQPSDIEFHDPSEIYVATNKNAEILLRGEISDANYEGKDGNYFYIPDYFNHVLRSVAIEGRPTLRWSRCSTPLVPEFKAIT